MLMHQHFPDISDCLVRFRNDNPEIKQIYKLVDRNVGKSEKGINQMG